MRAPIYFDGSNDGLSLPNLPDVGNFTVSFWVFPTATENTAIFAWDNFPTTPRNALVWKPSRGNIEFDFFVDDAGNGVATTDATLNQWNHAAFVREGADCTYYLNGTAITTITATGKATTKFTAENVRLGCHYFSAANNEFFVGGVQHVTMWDHALTPAQIAQLAKGQNANTAGIRPRWHLDGYGQKVTDYSPLAVTDIDVPVIAQYGNAPVRKIPKTFTFADVPSDSHLVPVRMPWKEQPPAGTPIDWENPITRKLGALYLPGQTNRDLVAHRHLTEEFGTFVKSVGVDGLEMDFSNGTLTHRSDPVLDDGGADASLFVLGHADGTSLDVHVACVEDVGGSAAVFEIYTDTNIVSYLRRATSSTACTATGPAHNGERFAALAVSETQTSRKLYTKVGKGNVATTSNTTDAGATADPLGNTSIAGYRYLSGTLNPLDGQNVIAAVWNRALTTAEAKSLLENPWQIFEPQIVWVPFDEAVADLATFEMDHTDMPWSPPS